jgi:DNA-binding transcriptional LysR family regulator
MEIHQLKYVLAISKHNNFTSAAKEINISQSSLSQQVSKLEKELGVDLFVRTTRSVQLTPAGTEFVEHAKQVLLAIRETRQCINEYTTNEKGLISLGILPIIGYYRLPNLLASFNKIFPGIKFDLLENQCERLLSMILDCEIDAAIVQQTLQSPHLQFYKLINDKMVVVTSNNHPLATKKSVTLQELKDESFIIPPRPSGHYHDFFEACRAADFEPNILMTCSHVRTILGLVREELGITMLSSYVAALDVDPSLTIIPLTPEIDRKIYLAMRVNSENSPILKIFAKFALQWADANLH